MEHLVNNDGSRASLLKRKIENVCEPNAALDEARIVETDAGAFQHFAVCIDANEAARAAGREFENASGPCAKV